MALNAASGGSRRGCCRACLVERVRRKERESLYGRVVVVVVVVALSAAAGGVWTQSAQQQQKRHDETRSAPQVDMAITTAESEWRTRADAVGRRR